MAEQREFTLSCERCGGVDGAIEIVRARRPNLNDGISINTTVYVRCSRCRHLTPYHIADMGGVIKVYAQEELR